MNIMTINQTMFMTRNLVVDSDSYRLQCHVGAAESATPTSMRDEIIIRLDIQIKIIPNRMQQ
jgi:hypothetical protein